MRKGFVAMALLSLFVFGTALTAVAAHKGLTAAEKAFIKDTASGGNLEVQLGRVAQTKAGSQAVKDFGKMMETDHTKAAEELKSLASQYNIQPPAQLERKDQAMLDRLSKYSGGEFDKNYMAAMVEDHKKDVAKFKAASKKSKDAALKQWIDKTLPTLEEHLQHAKETAKQVGAK